MKCKELPLDLLVVSGVEPCGWDTAAIEVLDLESRPLLFGILNEQNKGLLDITPLVRGFAVEPSTSFWEEA